MHHSLQLPSSRLSWDLFHRVSVQKWVSFAFVVVRSFEAATLQHLQRHSSGIGLYVGGVGNRGRVVDLWYMA